MSEDAQAEPTPLVERTEGTVLYEEVVANGKRLMIVRVADGERELFTVAWQHGEADPEPFMPVLYKTLGEAAHLLMRLKAFAS